MELTGLIHKPSEKMPPTQFVGGIFPRKHISIVSAKSGVGKTWFVLKLLTDLSNGGTIFNGMAYYEPKRHGILFCGETGIELVMERQHKMHDKADDDYFSIVSRTEALRKKIILDVDRPDGVTAIYNISKDLKADIVVLDTLMSFRTDDESAMQTTNFMMTNLQRLAESLNSAVIITHHVRKKQAGNDRIDQDEIIGSSALVRQCAAAFIITKNGRNYSLNSVKAWWNVPEAIHWRMFDDSYGQVVFEEARFEEGGNMTQRRLRAEEYLEHLEPDEEITVKEIADKFGFDKHTAQRIIEKRCQMVKESQGSAPAVYKFVRNSALN